MNRYLFFLIIITVSINSFGQKKEISKLAIGDKAPDFNLPGIDDKNYTLADFKKYEYLAIVFTCNHCPTAQAYEDKLIKLVSNYRPKGVGFVAISPNAPSAISLSELGYSDLGDDLEDMKIRAKNKNFDFPYLYDGETQETSLKYGPLATPHVFVFDKERKLQYSGRIDNTENPYIEPKETTLINALDNLLAGKKIDEPFTKTFGCSVKWAWKGDWVQQQLEEWSKEPVLLNEINLSEIQSLMKNDGKNLRMINVWTTWCGPCIIEFPELVNINRMYRGRDFEFLSISADYLSKKDKALDILKKKEASNDNYIFSDEDIYQLIEAVDSEWQGSLPYTGLIAPGGEIIYRIEGAIEPQELKEKIVEYLGRFYANDK